jgi:alkyl hydroperoxide reductase subunit AhpC
VRPFWPCGGFHAGSRLRLAEAIRLKPEWDRRGVKLIGLSVDAADIRVFRTGDIQKIQDQDLNFPVVADTDGRVATLFGMTGHAMDRALTGYRVFILDCQRKVRLLRRYPLSTTLSFAEILRVIDSLQTADAERVSIPSGQANSVRIAVSHPPSSARASAPTPNSRPFSGQHAQAGGQPSSPHRS